MATSAALVCLAVAVASVAVFFARPLLTRFRVIASSGDQVGEVIALPRETFSTDRTLIVFGRKSCGACRAAAPELGRLLASVQGRPGWRMVIVTDDADGEWARQIGLESDHVVRADLRALGIKAVPTIIVADRDGRARVTRRGVDGSLHDLMARTANDEPH